MVPETKRRLFGLLSFALLALFTYGVWRLGLRLYPLVTRYYAIQLHASAWQAVYSERGLPTPPDGPREGYWGKKIGKTIRHPAVGWTLPEVHIPRRLDIEADGMQHVRVSTTPQTRILIVGASLAFGACSSDIANTYFTRLAALLAEKSYPPEITVLAAGGWKSSQELEAVRRFGLPARPDVVLFLDGLNDLTNGSNARVVYGEPTKTLDGSPWHGLYHEHDYPDRVRVYLDNMGAAVRLLRENRIGVVLALQPSLFEKKTLTPLERKLAKNTLHYLGDPEDLRTSFERMRVGLRDLARAEGASFVDLSRIFDGENATMFLDAWHFPDPGHRILAERLAEALLPVIATP